MFSPLPDDICMLMKFLSNSPVCHLTANTFPQLPLPAVVSVTANQHFAVNRWNNAYAGTQASPSSGGGTGERGQGGSGSGSAKQAGGSQAPAAQKVKPPAQAASGSQGQTQVQAKKDGGGQGIFCSIADVLVSEVGH